MAQDNKAARIWIWLTTAAYVVALIFLVLHGYCTSSAEADPSDAAWALTMFIAFVLTGLALTCLGVLDYLHNLYLSSDSMVADLRRLMSGQTQSEALLTQINENQLLSDAIKSVAFREKDRQVLIQAVQEDIRKEHWESAHYLIDELENNFGLRKEAQQLREELQRYSEASIQEKIAQTIKNIESLWIIHHYDDAQKEVDILMRLYPDQPRVQALKGRTEQLRQQHKKELLDRWDAAVRDNDVDQGVEILKLLDQYLTPSEAAALEESARGVFRAKLHNMGVQFSLFVTEKKWAQAYNIGKKIIAEYPNSRMAQEVREKLDILKQRAAHPGS